jgi:hypothetical protein
MDRRGFLRLLGGAAVTAVAAPAVTHVLPPLGGWRQEQNGLYVNNARSNSTWAWSHKTPEEIMADVNAMLTATWERSAELEWPNFIGVSALSIKRLAKTHNEEFLAYTPRGSKSIKAMLTVQNRKVTDVQLYGV